MPITSLHPDYIERAKQWERCRDAYDGQDAIKKKGVTYLPRLTKQRWADYQAYKDRALFFSITSKTVSALVGMALVRPPVVTMPPDMASYFEDDQGVQFYELLSSTLAEVLLMGRFGVLVDRPASGGAPYPKKYYCENIINWDIDEIGRPNLIVLSEVTLVEGQDKYDKVYATQYRELSLIDGVYYQTLYDAKGNIITAPFAPTNFGNTMDHIPFYICGSFGVGFDVLKPPMLDIVDINLSHYRTSADLEHGRHFTALPTPWVSGASATQELYVGSTAAWVLPDPNARAGYLEFTGQGLGSLEKALQEKQSQLASMSARLLDNSRRGSEAAETVRLRYSAETASLAMIVRATEAFETSVYREIAAMEALDTTSVAVKMNKELLDPRLSTGEVLDLVKSYFDGGITEETLIFNLRRGDMIASGRSDDEEIAAVKATRALLLASRAPKSTGATSNAT